MPLRKVKPGSNMYQGWVTHCWSPIIGCPHACEYCYVKAFRDQPRIPELRDDFPNLGKDKKIFVGHLCDMFAENVPMDMIVKILMHCKKYTENEYIFQSKNPWRMARFTFPLQSLFGTTIETNRNMYGISKAPPVYERAEWINALTFPHKFVTIEPILDFDLPDLMHLIKLANPDFVNIGADSKEHRLPEPSKEKVLELIYELTALGIEIRKKTNLTRLI